jgi:peptidoglycan/LPS O-acetylase OafA/YrhL
VTAGTTASITTAPALPRLTRLTSLRFFAATAVVVYHCCNVVVPLRLLRQYVGYGYTAVTFFFILSGFVLTWSHDPAGPILGFYCRRLARIWPLHLVTTLAAVVVVWASGKPQDLTGLALTIPLLHAWAPSLQSTFAYNNPSWSLSCEAFFYAGFPALVLAGRRLLRSPASLLAAGLALAALMVVSTAAYLVLTPVPLRDSAGFLLYVNPAFRLPEFALGIVLALAMRGGWRPRVRLEWAVMSVAGAYLFMVTLGLAWPVVAPERLPSPVGDMALAGPFALLIVTAATRDLTAATGRLTQERLVRLGEWSFALYLVHELVLQVAVPLDRDTGFWPAVAVAAVLVVASIALAGWLHRTVEQPWERRLRPRRPVDRSTEPEPARV